MTTRPCAWTLLLGLFLLLNACASPVAPSVAPTPNLPRPAESTATPTAIATPSSTPQPTISIESADLRGLHIEVWHAFTGETARLFEEQVALFNAYNEWGITVSATAYRDYLSLEEALQAVQGNERLPALVVALPEQGLAWQAAGLTVELTPYLHDPRYGLTEEEWADFPSVYFLGSGFPAQRSARFLFYNQTWAQELGFAAPPQTPADFRQQACAANAAFRADRDVKNDGFGGWMVDTHWQTIYTWLLAFGSEVSAEGAYTFRTDPNLAAFTFLKQLFDDVCAWLSTANVPYQPFAERKALFLTADLTEVPAIAAVMGQSNPEDVWTPLPFPGQEKPVLAVYGPDYILLRSEERQQLAAWLFVRWIVAPERQAIWTEQTGTLPLRLSLTQLLQDYRSASPAWAQAVAYLPAAHPTPSLASWLHVRLLLADGARFIFQTGWPVEKLPFVLDTIQTMAEEMERP